MHKTYSAHCVDNKSHLYWAILFCCCSGAPRLISCFFGTQGSRSAASTTGSTDTTQQMSEEANNMLISMGFSPDRATAALRECGGNLENAANLLLSGWHGDAPSASSPNIASNEMADSSGVNADDAVQMVESPLSQYSVENGKSACTCIGLMAADQILREASVTTPTFNAELLQQAVLGGVDKYTMLVKSRTSTVEHLSAEEVLRTGVFDSLELGDVLQGITSSGQLGFRALLPPTQLSIRWRCVLIIKPPETVLCCLPPKNYAGTDPAPFCLVDSHPRQYLFGTEGSYIRKHNTLDGLIDSLERIFPSTSLGSEFGEVMAASEWVNLLDGHVI